MCAKCAYFRFVFYFVVYTNHKISRSTVLHNFWVLSSSYTLFSQLTHQDANKATNETEKAREKENKRIGSKILDDFMDELVLPGATVSIWYTPSVIHASLCFLQFFYRKSIFQQYTLSNRFISQQPPPPIRQVHLPAVSPSIHLRFTWYNPLAIFYLHMKRSRSLRWHSKSQVSNFFLFEF